MASRKPVILTHTIGAEAAPLFDGDRLIADVDIMADSENENPVTIEFSETGSVEMQPGEVHVLIGCNLATLIVDGTEGEKVKVFGNTTA